MFAVECLSMEEDRLVEYRLFKSIEDANKFLIWKAKDVGSTDLDLKAGTLYYLGEWCHLKWVRKEVHPE